MGEAECAQDRSIMRPFNEPQAEENVLFESLPFWDATTTSNQEKQNRLSPTDSILLPTTCRNYQWDKGITPPRLQKFLKCRRQTESPLLSTPKFSTFLSRNTTLLGRPK